MIDEAMEFIRREVRTHLELTDGEVQLESARILTQEGGADGVAISLVNVEEEPTLRNTPHTRFVNGQPMIGQPSVFMNLYLLFAFDFPNYGTSLHNLSRTVELFQHRRLFQEQDGSPANPWPGGLLQLAFDHHNLSFEALNNLWSVLGGTMLPALLYKARLVELRQPESEDAAVPIDTISMDLGT